MSRSRERTTAAALCGAGAAVTLLAAGRTWVRVSVDLPHPLPDTTHALTGQQLAAAAGALGIAGLAGLAGLVATRGFARLVVGVLLCLFGVAIAYASIRGVAAGSVDAALAAEDVLVRGETTGRATTPWWVVSAAGGGLLALSGLLTAVRGRLWPAMSRRYDPPAGSAPDNPRDSDEGEDLWESLDHGRDPTA